MIGAREVEIVVAGARVVARADRALVWRAESTVFLADLHLGKAAAFRRAGIAVPEQGTAEDLSRITAIVREERAIRVVILGDFFHARAGRTAAVADAVAAWRDSIRDVEVVLIRGNHDRNAGDPPASLAMRVEDNGARIGPFVARHEPDEDARGYVVAGHIHPAVRLDDPMTGRGIKAPCFWFGAGCAVLPAFGGFTGTAVVAPRRGDRVAALIDGNVVEIPVREGARA